MFDTLQFKVTVINGRQVVKGEATFQNQDEPPITTEIVLAKNNNDDVFWLAIDDSLSAMFRAKELRERYKHDTNG